jgi:hypothetical protein
MQDTVQPLTKVYRLGTPVRIFLCFLYLLLAIGGLDLLMLLIEILQNHSFDALLAWFLGLSLLALFTYGTLPLWNMRLELSPEGVTYINPAYCRIYTPWENIAQIASVSRFPVKVSLILRTPAARNIPFGAGKQQRQAVIERCSLLTTKTDLKRRAYVIPLIPTMPKKDLKNGTFNAYLQHYAPHLSQDRTTI